MKFIIEPRSFEEIKNTINYVDAYVLGITNMSVNMNMYVTLDELTEIDNYLKANNKELFVCVNKNMHNGDLDNLKDILLSLNDYSITGLFYYDVSVLNLKNKLDLNYDLVWASEHYTTNYNTINYWYDFGVNYTLISGEITIDEILEISKNTKSNLIVPIFGYLPMYVSKRHGVKNYLDYFNLSDDSLVNYLEKEGVYYPVIDNNVGTMAYSGNILNGICEMNNLKESGISYVLLNGFDIDEDSFIKVLDMYKSVNKDNIKLYEESINKMFPNVNYGFLYTKTISKVKKNDK